MTEIQIGESDLDQSTHGQDKSPYPIEKSRNTSRLQSQQKLSDHGASPNITHPQHKSTDQSASG